MRLFNILLCYFASVFYILLIVFLLYKNPRSRLNRFCALAILPFAIWSTAFIFFNSAVTPDEAMAWLNIASIGWCSFPSFVLFFYMEFTGYDGVVRNPLMMILCIVPALFCIYWQQAGYIIAGIIKQPYGWSYIIKPTLPLAFFILYYIGFVATSIYLIYDYGRKAKTKRDKKAARLFFITPLLTVILSSLTDIIFPLFEIAAVPPIGVVFILIWANGFVFAISNYKLMELTPAGAADEIIATMSDALILLDPDYKIAFANNAAYDLLGYSPDELQNKPFGLITAPTADEKIIGKLLAGFTDINSHEMYLKAKNGENIPVWISASVVKDKFGESTGIVINARDVREHKKIEQDLRESEEKYRNLVEHALIGIGIHQNNKIVYANEKFAAMLGYTRKDVTGRWIADIIHPEERSFILERAARRQSGSSEPDTYEIRFLRNDGSFFYALISNVLIEYNGNIATLFNIVDITDTKSRIELEQINKELESFSYTVSHDLRAPLRSIKGFGQALLEDYEDMLDAEGADYLRRICAAAKRMEELVDDLLELSRLGRAELCMSSVNLSEICCEIAAELKDLEPQRQVKIVIAKDITAYGDKNLLRVVMENLLQNAWKFTGNNPNAKIEFGVMHSEDGPIYFVRDNGTGFDMSYADKLFKPFQRLHTEAEFPGTGVGLATVYKIIQRHGGKIWAESQKNKGTTFYFTLPL
ncbi:PAS domain S-box protein [Tepidanaerobacter sp. EBM-38]|uniref:PAS domain S-box protein n=1 Tax=Tepidanaerobacter sp. EBM-38 TaxID=1918496 RepID=UPI0025F6419A|nr:PAS domain S-box protein [Tepidanaerobacter sp. EBM-38]